MLDGWVIALASLVYLGVLFAIAFYGDRRADAGTSIINSPYVYALSLAVYASSWTYYGSVGRAARSGVGFMPIYLGPTLVAALWWTVLRKMIRISKNNHITSIADFMASRYGKSALLGGLVTLVAVVGLVPYIALQLKAVSASVAVLTHAPGIASGRAEAGPWWSDPTLYIALLLATFTIVFGTRHLDASERHEGMVAAIAFESLVKLVAFLAVGAFVTFGIYDGFGDLFARAQAVPALNALLTLHGGEAGAGGAAFGSWASLIVLSMLSIMLLPRQFQIAVVENMDENHVAKAVWVLPLYLLAINVFVLPIAFGGTMHFPGGAVDPDMFVLALPMREHQLALTLFVFIGGLSAATGMVIVETIALSTMVCNDIVMPVLLRLQSLQSERRANFPGLLLTIRRAAIVLLMMLGYAYFRLAGEAYALVSIGLISFAAVAQFAPAMLGAIYWKNGTRLGALTGLSAGFLLWAYTLLLPSFAESGWLPRGFLAQGPLGIEWLRPRQLFGLQGLDEVSHALFWSMLANVAGFVGVSLARGQSVVEKTQAALFVDAYAHTGDTLRPDIWRGSASTEAVLELLRRFLGSASADDAYARFHHERGGTNSPTADADLVRFAERQLAGAIGAASARAMIATVVDEEPLGLNEVMAILDETSQVVAYSHQLEQKSRELESASAELKAANARLSELDRMKDDFISTVTHELRTPLTSIRAFSEILREHPDLPAAKRGEYLDIVIKESERLTRLINNVLDLAKMESGSAQWHAEPLDLKQVIEDAANATRQMFAEQRIELELDLPAAVPLVLGDHDRLMQVVLNLLSNAAKFCDRAGGRVAVRLVRVGAALRVEVRDNGPGVRAQDRELIFEKFRQGGDTISGKPQGTGLGLPISREIVRHFGGTLRLESAPGEPGEGEGAVFVFTLPLASATETTS
ncbi:ATP-binding protein [Paraburkholderia sp. RL17-381-BIF-C]|jgi:Na+/proline symporter/nitrogen-specific signal transduction histidine kinase|uniref:ATP-binding protein n=1 Tax=Paraburkholderia sp. RL17-381-BIF-C TaxID=3031635 RepID=UPI0038B8549C